MKKLFMMATIGVVGMLSANGLDSEPIVESSCEEATIATCYSYGIYVHCTDTMLEDTICYGEGTDVPTIDDAQECIRKNGEGIRRYYCGEPLGVLRSISVN